MEGSSWRIPPATNGNNPPQHQYQQQHQYAQQQPPQQQPPYPPRGNPPVDSWRNVARENNAAINNNPTSASSSYSRRDRSRSPRDRSRRRSPDDRRRRSRSRDRYRKRSPDERGESANRGAAAPKRIFITHLPADMQHEPLTMLFARQGFMPSDVKIFDKQYSGSVRSMAIVEFVDVASAKKWMEQNQSQLTIPDGRKVGAEYVTTTEDDCLKRRDWICAKCTETNYQMRETCFRCNATKADNGSLEARGYADIDRDEKPTDTLLVRDLPAGVSDGTVLSVLQRVTQGQLRFGQVKLSDSREFAWVQMRNANDAEMLLNCFKKSPLQIQGSIVITTFSRRPLSVILAEPVVTERPKQPVVEEQPQMPMHPPPGAPSAYGQYGAPPPGMGAMPGMPPGMPQMMAPQGMMQSPFGMPPPGMQPMQQQQQPGAAPAAGGHVNTSMPPPNFGLPPPGMGGMMQQQPQQGMMQQQQQQHQPPPSMQQQMGMMGGAQQQPPQHQQLLQSQLAAAAHMGMLPNMAMPPPMQQQAAAAAAAAAAYNMPPPHMQQQMQQQQLTQESLLQAQLAAMAAQQAALQAEVERLAGGAAAHAAAPQQQPEKLGHILTPVGLLQQFEPPNPQTFTPEPSSGYMYDANTKLYYDPKTMYFYNMASGKWTYYDAHFKTYIAVEEREQVQQALHAGFGQNGSAAAAAAAAAADDKKEKTPAEIAKEMMKWAKKTDKQKVQMSLKPVVKPLETKSAFGSGIAAAAADYNAAGAAGGAAATPTTPTSGSGTAAGFGTEVTLKMLDRSKNALAHLNSDSDEEETPLPAGIHHHHHHQQQRHQDRQQQRPEPVKEEPKVKSAAEHREAMMATLIDRAGKQCLLCRRAFPSVEVLDKHISKSDLHKKNLEEKQIEWGKAYVASIMAATDGRGGGGDYVSVASTSAPASSAAAAGGSSSSSSWGSQPAATAADAYKYRDRAKERRNIHGIDAITADPFAHARDTGRGQISVEAQQRESDAAAARPLDSSNKGSKMLQKMGWTEGAGLGKNLQGIVAPIQAERRVEGTGLGLSGSKITHGMHASHQDKTRAALFARYQDDRS